MRNVKQKLSRQGGFTLIEMLIVVAIIAILIAISIPLVGSMLNRVREATDAANERAAKAEAIIVMLSGNIDTMNLNANSSDPSIYYAMYNAETGELKKIGSGTSGYGSASYGKCVEHGHENCYLFLRLNLADMSVKMFWGKSVNSAQLENIGWDTQLCGPDLMAGK